MMLALHGEKNNDYTGKIGIVYMGNIDVEEDKARSSRSKEKRLYSDVDSRGSGDAGSKSNLIGNKQERTYRTNSKKSIVIGSGSTDDGGAIADLVNEYRHQLAQRRNERYLIDQEIQRLEDKILEFEALQVDLQKNTVTP